MKKKVFRFLVYLSFSLLAIFLIEHLLLKARFMQVFNVNEHITSDLYFNDLYYSKYDEGKPSKFMQEDKKVILVNIQDISIEHRNDYLHLIKKLKSFKPNCIGVDITFSRSRPNVFKELDNNPDVIFAKGGQNDIHFKNCGDVRFPQSEEHEQRTIRYYKNNPSTFASKLVKAYDKKQKTSVGGNPDFLLHYNAINGGLSHLINDNNEQNNNYTTDFWYLNSKEVVNDSLNLFADYFKNKIVIIGYLGNRNHINSKFDIEDKFRIPADTKHFINKEPLMNGAVIHAVAISNILSPAHQFKVVSTELIQFIQFIICSVFLVLLLFYDFGKLLNRVLLFLLSIPLLFLVLYFMDQLIFIKLGGTLFALLIIEEMFEILEPYEHKYLSKYFNHD
jgi:CHASE2 domain-containing sensor protein